MLKVAPSFRLYASPLSAVVKALQYLLTSITRFTEEKRREKEKTRPCSKETHTRVGRSSEPRAHWDVQGLSSVMCIQKKKNIWLVSVQKHIGTAHPELIYCLLCTVYQAYNPNLNNILCRCPLHTTDRSCYAWWNRYHIVKPCKLEPDNK